MSDVVIITNNVPRVILDAMTLSETRRKQFDYLDWEALERGEDSRSFVRYKGEFYDLNETEGTFPYDRRWFYVSDSFFSGVLFRYAPAEDPRSAARGEIDPDYIICGRYVMRG